MRGSKYVMYGKKENKKQIDKTEDKNTFLKITGLNPISQEELMTRAIESEKAIANKNFITLQELQNEMQKW